MQKIVRTALLLLALCLLQQSALHAVMVHDQGPRGELPVQGLAEAPPNRRAAPDKETMLVSAARDERVFSTAQSFQVPRQEWKGSPAPAGAAAEEGAKTRQEEAEEKTEEEAEEEEEDEEFEEEFGDPSEQEVYDPFSGYNRAMTGFNDGFYTWVLDPTARGYRYITPVIARRGIRNFFNNLLFPVRFINNLLQVKFLNAGEEFLRFCINTTIGILGFWDPAKEWFGLEAHPEDFGQTLGYYGVGAGPHIVLPFFGPSNLRDMAGMVPDYFLDPVSYIDDDLDELGVKAFRQLNETSLQIGEYDNLKKDAIDLYPFLRDIYEQNRKKKIAE